VLEEIAQLSDRLIVMSNLAVNLLVEVYGFPREKIDMIPHGVPDIPFEVVASYTVSRNVADRSATQPASFPFCAVSRCTFSLSEST
jgi:hypothetical protein